MSLHKKKFSLAILVLVILVIWFLPFEEIWSTIQFRFMPESAKTAHFVRLTQSEGAQQIYLLGTVHGRHFISDSTYPYWELRSVIENLKPDLLLLEIRPQEFIEHRWGESPAEMSYAALIGQSAGISIAGMDYWLKNYNSIKDFDDREDRMLDLVMEKIINYKNILILTGYSHISGFKRRLSQRGFSNDFSYAESAKLDLLHKNIISEIPPEYFIMSSQAISKVKSGHSDFTQEWAKGREELLLSLQSKTSK